MYIPHIGLTNDFLSMAAEGKVDLTSSKMEDDYKEGLKKEACRLKSFLSDKYECASKGGDLKKAKISLYSENWKTGLTHIVLKAENSVQGTETRNSAVFSGDKILEARVCKEKFGIFLGYETYFFNNDGSLKKYEAETCGGYYNDEPIDLRVKDKVNINF